MEKTFTEMKCEKIKQQDEGKNIYNAAAKIIFVSYILENINQNFL